MKNSPPFRWQVTAALLDAGIFAGVLVVMSGLLELSIAPKRIADLTLGVIACSLLTRLVLVGRINFLSRSWVRAVAVTAVVFLGAGVLAYFHWFGWSYARWFFVGGATLGLGIGFHVIRRACDPRNVDAGESLRLVALAAGAGWVFRPFLTPQLLGGLDAHWYGHIMIDALQQAHAGIWPVFLGQGELMFNGAVHPFRTAPYLHHFGILLDALTFRGLTPLAVQHLTVIVTAVLGAMNAYLCMSALALARRWLAWAMALGYISGPAVAAAIYAQEMYMTFMAYGWLPLVVYGNIRLIRRDDMKGWWVLVAGLAIVWSCHAPVGTWSTLVTFAVQGLRLAARDFNRRSWVLALGGSVLFAGLTGYYFFSIAELSPANTGGTHALFAYGSGAVLGLLALVRLLASGSRIWLAVGAVALVILWSTHRLYFGWLGVALIFGAGLVSLEKKWPTLRLKSWVPEALALLLVGSGLLSVLVFPELDGARLIRSAQAYDLMARLFPKNFQLVSWSAHQLADLQPGYAVMAGLVVGLLAIAVRPTWEVRMLTLAGLALTVMIVPVPRLTALCYQAVPDPIYGISTVSVWLRLMPVLVTVAIFTGFLAMAAAPRRFWLNLAIGLGAADLLVAHWCEATKFIHSGELAINSSDRTAAFYRPENAQLYSYVYNSLPHPTYLMNGVVDYHLESRLLDVKTRELRRDPVLEEGFDPPIALTTAVGPEGPNWLRITPAINVPAGERRLLKFQFTDRPYLGTIVMKGPRFYRDYYLPDAGFYVKSFGSAPGRPNTLAVWNSSASEQAIALSYIDSSPENLGKEFGDFARLSVRSYRPADLQIQTRSLTPYRADVELKEPMYLETPRVYIPGYRARVDGISKKVEVSPDHLAMVRVDPGHHTVDVFYTGTFAARMIFRGSALIWLGVIFYALRSLRLRLMTATLDIITIPADSGPLLTTVFRHDPTQRVDV